MNAEGKKRIAKLMHAIGKYIAELGKDQDGKEILMSFGLAAGTVCGTDPNNMRAVGVFMDAFSSAVRSASSRSGNPLEFQMEANLPPEEPPH